MFERAVARGQEHFGSPRKPAEARAPVARYLSSPPGELATTSLLPDPTASTASPPRRQIVRPSFERLRSGNRLSDGRRARIPGVPTRARDPRSVGRFSEACAAPCRSSDTQRLREIVANYCAGVSTGLTKFRLFRSYTSTNRRAKRLAPLRLRPLANWVAPSPPDLEDRPAPSRNRAAILLQPSPIDRPRGDVRS